VTKSRLHARLQLAALLANVASFLVLALLAPGVLLLEPDVATAALVESAWTYPLVLGLAAIATALRMRGFHSTVAALEQGEGDMPGVDAKLVRRLHGLPLSWVGQLALQSVVVTALTIVPDLRPSIIDLKTQISIVLLNTTVTAAVSLPLYVVSRAFTAGTLASVPWRIAQEAMRKEDGESESSVVARFLAWLRAGPLGRVDGRLLYAVALPVAIAAFGAALLVDAHVRAFETRSRRDDAYALARGLLEPEGSAGTAGRAAAMQVADRLGYHVEITSEEQEPFSTVATPGEGGVRTLRTKLEDGTAIVRFQPTSGGSPIVAYAVAAALAIALAALIGRNIGHAVSIDLTSATREVRMLGTQDVLRGATRVAGPARFSEVAALGTGVEQVAERFREFARGRERMIDARESAQRMRDLFLASMSHDLRSPLNGILGFVTLLQKAGLSPPQMESLAIIDRRGRELLDLIENILDAAKIEAGRLELARDYAAPQDILANVVERGRELTQEKPAGERVEVVAELQPGIAPIYVDEKRLTQAVVNLVANAVKFVDRGVVRVRISQGAHGPYGKNAVKFEVEDQGRGIPEKELAQIFEAFRQPLRSRRHGGLGLGLSMTRALVELHGGTIEVASSPERGSVFTLWIPFVAPGEESQRVSLASLRKMSAENAPRSVRNPVPMRPSESTMRRALSEQEFPTLQMPALEIPPDPDAEFDAKETLPLPPKPSNSSPPPPLKSRPPPPRPAAGTRPNDPDRTGRFDETTTKRRE